MANTWIRATATGNVGTGVSRVLHSVTLVGGSDAATLVIKQDGSAGTQIGPTIKAAAGLTAHLHLGGVAYSGQLHATFTGTGPEAGFEIGL